MLKHKCYKYVYITTLFNHYSITILYSLQKNCINNVVAQTLNLFGVNRVRITLHYVNYITIQMLDKENISTYVLSYIC